MRLPRVPVRQAGRPWRLGCGGAGLACTATRCLPGGLDMWRNGLIYCLRKAEAAAFLVR